MGLRLREARLSAGLTQARLAEMAGLQPNSVSLMENGSLAPTLTTLVNFARALGVQPKDLLDFAGESVLSPAPTDAEAAGLLADFSSLDAESRAAVRGLVRTMRRRQGSRSR